MSDTDPADRLPLRERKKRATRQRLSDVATRLIARRGFDNVTVTEIADAADVSKVTLFKYFARKEDLYLDRGPEALDTVTRAITERPGDRTPVDALHDTLRRLLTERHPLSGLGDRYAGFFTVIADSPALLSRARELADELERHLVTVLAADAGTEVDDLIRLRAALIMAALRTVYLSSARRLLAGETVADIADDQLALLDTAFDAVRRGWPA